MMLYEVCILMRRIDFTALNIEKLIDRRVTDETVRTIKAHFSENINKITALEK